MKKTNDVIKKIPVYLSLSRLLFTPIIILLGIFNLYIPIIILTIIAAITDFFDGFLANKWLVQSTKGTKLDIGISKLFVISLFLVLAFKIHIFIIPLILEIIIGLSNLYYYNKTKDYKTLPIGSIKIILSFILILIALINIKTTRLLNAFIYATTNIQVLTIASYYINYTNNIFEAKEQENQKKRKKRVEELEDKTIMLDKIEDLLKDYEKNDIL